MSAARPEYEHREVWVQVARWAQEMLNGDWCPADDCPLSVCGGPHTTHDCPGLGTVTLPADDVCPFCGLTP